MIQEAVLSTIKPLLETRVFAYDFLRRTFLVEPSQDYLRSLSENQLVSAFPFQEEDPELAEGTAKVQDYLNTQDVLSAEGYDRLHWDYTRLFIGPYSLPAPPWESAYLNKDKLLFQEETRRVRLAYLKYGFLPKHYQQEADDHLGLELDFMYQLANLTVEKAVVGDLDGFKELLQDQADFLEQHLLLWVPAFAKNVRLSANTGFYQGMARMLQGFIQIDGRAVKELLDIECKFKFFGGEHSHGKSH
ncbi:TorD/DmsD family molecular chaperone [Desulfosporosinus youngiae]|uniref:Putative component of anaerobic dehydrogenase n=1 Tax=Desulfosporosinus youngiae DSM 17734 TaxID=768710 RepID=H5Y5N0_9FIRM|nr:molecular chaperone TorD family protein [Desulfosporosinus youngiae]EHQ90617.1 putative component of anaerobic dehydrogenase [Desulfosporosinus youngiae DSM 17734]